jgi:hypothetical protein
VGAIIFSKTGVATLTFARADAFPRPRTGDEGQVTGESQAGLIRVATLRAPREYITLNWSGKTAMLATDYVALGVFLKDPLVQFRSHPFTFTDVDGTAALVRYWAGYYTMQTITPTLLQGQLVLRKEVLA